MPHTHLILDQAVKVLCLDILVLAQVVLEPFCCRFQLRYLSDQLLSLRVPKVSAGRS
jgi:hypothetical protein